MYCIGLSSDGLLNKLFYLSHLLAPCVEFRNYHLLDPYKKDKSPSRVLEIRKILSPLISFQGKAPNLFAFGVFVQSFPILGLTASYCANLQ